MDKTIEACTKMNAFVVECLMALALRWEAFFDSAE